MPMTPSDSARLLHNTDDTGSFTEPCPEYAVCVLEHTILQAHDNKLTALEPHLDQASDILSMTQIKGRINFVKNIHGRRLELEEGKNEGECDEGSMFFVSIFEVKIKVLQGDETGCIVAIREREAEGHTVDHH